MIDLYKLRYFLTVARAGSYVQAAEELHVSQPALSRSIQSLERQYEVALLDRGRGGVTLTRAGQQLMQYADDLLYNAETLERMLAGAATGTSGEVEFGIGPVAATVVLPTVAADVAREYPAISLRAHSESVGEMASKLLNGEVEFFLGRVDRTSQNDRFLVDILGSASFRIFAREGHPLAGSSSATLADLRPFPRLGGTAWNEFAIHDAPLEERELLTPTVQIDNYSILREIALRTDGVIMSSYGDLTGLVPLPISTQAEQTMSSQIAMFYLSSRNLSPAARTVARLVRSAALEAIPMTDTRPEEPKFLGVG
jgi:DNA-binding transcriptional LysR family regulator